MTTSNPCPHLRPVAEPSDYVCLQCEIDLLHQSALKDEDTIQDQAAEIERLHRELDAVKRTREQEAGYAETCYQNQRLRAALQAIATDEMSGQYDADDRWCDDYYRVVNEARRALHDTGGAADEIERLQRERDDAEKLAESLQNKWASRPLSDPDLIAENDRSRARLEHLRQAKLTWGMACHHQCEACDEFWEAFRENSMPPDETKSRIGWSGDTSGTPMGPCDQGAEPCSAFYAIDKCRDCGFSYTDHEPEAKTMPAEETSAAQPGWCEAGRHTFLSGGSSCIRCGIAENT